MSHEEAILLGILSLGAFFVPLLNKRLSLPSAVGEICFGLALGFFIQGIRETMPTIKFLSELGFLLLMYLAGLEIDFPAIQVTSKKQLSFYGLFFMILAACCWGAAHRLGQSPFYGLIYFTTTIGLLFPVLKETGLLEKTYGQVLLLLGSIGEMLSLLGLTIFILYVRFGLSLNALRHLALIAGFFLLCYLIARLFRLYVWWHPKKIGIFLQTGDSSETGIRANLVNMFLFVSLAAIFDIELIIGAFLGGALFALIFKKREEIKNRLSAFGYGFLIPLFFIEVGLRFNLADFLNLSVLGEALLICGTIVAARAVAGSALLFSKIGARRLLLLPLGLSFPLTLLVAVAAVGLQEQIIGRREGTVIVVAAVLSALICPWLFKVGVKRLLPSGSAE